MTISITEKFRLKKLLKELDSYKGRHTELVTVYIPAGYDIIKIINHLQQEQGTANNIKSASTRKNVIDALEKMIQHLKLYPQTPPHGLAVFSGNVAEKEGQSDVRVWSIEPPVPLNFRIYRCDKNFVTEGLHEMLEDKDVYGLVVLDRRDATLALLKGKSIKILKKTHSEVPGKMRAGGQSAARFSRLREGAIKEHYKKIAEYMKNEFLNLEGLKGIIIGGPGVTVDDFLNKDYVTGEIKKKIIATKDLSYTDEWGIQELVDKSQDILAQEQIAEEKKLMKEFFNYLAKNPKKVTYGKNDVIEKLEYGLVDTVLISESVDEKSIEEISTKAEKVGTTVKIISTETSEGVQLKEMGGYAAILRYECT